MNKIILDKEENILENVDGTIILNKLVKKIIFKGINIVTIAKVDYDLNLEIELLDNSSLDLKYFTWDDNTNITFKQNNNTNLLFRKSFYARKNSLIKLKNIIVGNNNKSNLKVRAISYKESISIDVLLDVLNSSKDNEVIEDLKGINYGGLVLIKPNMEINTSEVLANHYVTISSINKDDLFYLESKGLEPKISEKLILEGFLKGIMEVKNDE